MSTSRKQGNRPISESPLLRAFAASSRSTNAGTRSAGTCSSVMLSAEPIQVATESSQNDFDVEHGSHAASNRKEGKVDPSCPVDMCG